MSKNNSRQPSSTEGAEGLLDRWHRFLREAFDELVSARRQDRRLGLQSGRGRSKKKEALYEQKASKAVQKKTELQAELHKARGYIRNLEREQQSRLRELRKVERERDELEQQLAGGLEQLQAEISSSMEEHYRSQLAIRDAEYQALSERNSRLVLERETLKAERAALVGRLSQCESLSQQLVESEVKLQHSEQARMKLALALEESLTQQDKLKQLISARNHEYLGLGHKLRASQRVVEVRERELEELRHRNIEQTAALNEAAIELAKRVVLEDAQKANQIAATEFLEELELVAASNSPEEIVGYLKDISISQPVLELAIKNRPSVVYWLDHLLTRPDLQLPFLVDNELGDYDRWKQAALAVAAFIGELIEGHADLQGLIYDQLTPVSRARLKLLGL